MDIVCSSDDSTGNARLSSSSSWLTACHKHAKCVNASVSMSSDPLSPSRRGDEAVRPHAQRPSAQVPELAHAPRGVHGAPAPPPPCRGLTPHRSLKWPAREGGLAFGAHQVRSSAEARFTSRTENCYTTILPTNHKKVLD